jgi:aerobic-type carbon monoxide dehydrogenase small subunit (CoxS/CutS family)
MKRELTITVNGYNHTLLVDPHRTLLDVIRHDLGLTGTKSACEMGECGACTVLLNGEEVTSCLVLALEADGQEVVTIEGMSMGGELHPIQRAFVENGAIQCGFCTPGMIVTAKALLDRNPGARDEDIRQGLLGNLCRCTGYTKIAKAVEAARDRMREETDR